MNILSRLKKLLGRADDAEGHQFVMDVSTNRSIAIAREKEVQRQAAQKAHHRAGKGSR